MTVLRRLTVTLEMIKFQHTLFALPFAFTGMILAARGLPKWGTLLWVMLAMVGARSAAMTFNRIADRRFDAANPRTAGRALPAGKISLGFAVGFVVVSAGLFVLAAAMLNRWRCWSPWATRSPSVSRRCRTSCWGCRWPSRPWGAGWRSRGPLESSRYC